MKLKEAPQVFATQLGLRRLPVKQLLQRKSTTVPMVVSFTSIPQRLAKVHYTVKSLLNQTVSPEKIVLWLHEDLKTGLPKKLQQLQGDIFDIRYSPFTCPHRKLIHSLQAFPDAAVITCDDDSMYEPLWLQRLYEEHCAYPADVIANRCNLISYDGKGETLPYRNWGKVSDGGFTAEALMPAGYGGVVYPPASLDPRATDEKLFMQLAPRADDLWFKAMSVLKGTRSRRSRTPGEKPVTVFGSQSFKLGRTNIRQDENRLQWNAVAAYFDIAPLSSDRFYD